MTNGHARATKLATNAMNAVGANDNCGGYAAAQADYQRRLEANRAEGIARSVAHNQALRDAAIARKAAKRAANSK